MNPTEMFDVIVEHEAPAGRECVRRTMMLVLNWTKDGLDALVRRVIQAEADEDGHVGIVMNAEEAKALALLAMFGLSAAVKGYAANEAVE